MARLEDLLVDEQALDREMLAIGLMPYVRIGQTGSFRPAEKWESLSQKGKIVVTMLAARAAHALEKTDRPALSAGEVGTLAGVAGGTARPILRDLVEAHVLDQDEAKRYFVPAMCVPRALGLLK